MSEFDLKDVRKAALNGKIEYAGRKVGVDIANLGYEHWDVADCIVRLTEQDYRKSVYYGDVVGDVYVTKFNKHENDKADEIYIKLRLMGDCLEIEVMSFHLSS